jgi:hypothetical protein
MSLRRLRRGELLVLLALVLLLVALSVRWFDVLVPSAGSGDDVRAGGASGWSTLGHPWIELLVLGALSWVVVLVLAARAGAGRPTYGAVVAVVLAIPTTLLLLVLTLLRALAFPPGAPDVLSGNVGALFGSVDRFDVSLAAGGWLGLAALLLGLVGLWTAMSDDRSDAAESRAVPRPPVSEVPPLRAAPAAAEATPGEPGPERA